jgi:hypothetical protein
MKTPKDTQKPADTSLVAPPTDKSLVDASLYEQFAGAGFENQTTEDISIPFLVVLQGLSPQLTERPELRQGMILNTGTGDYYDGKEGVAFVPALTQHVFVEWKTRAAGGGFVGIHEVSSPVVMQAKEAAKKHGAAFGDYNTAFDADGKPIGNDLIETFYVYGISLGKDKTECQETTLAFTGSRIKKYRNWMTKARSIQLLLGDGRRIPAPLFAHTYRLKTVQEKNTKGSWFNWEVSFDGADAASARLAPTDTVFQSCVKMKTLIEEGKARASHESPAESEGSAEAPKAHF